MRDCPVSRFDVSANAEPSGARVSRAPREAQRFIPGAAAFAAVAGCAPSARTVGIFSVVLTVSAVRGIAER